MPNVLKNTKRESILYGCVIVANAEIAMSTASIIFLFSLKEFARFNDVEYRFAPFVVKMFVVNNSKLGNTRPKLKSTLIRSPSFIATPAIAPQLIINVLPPNRPMVLAVITSFLLLP